MSAPQNVEQLEDQLSCPSPSLIEQLAKLEGDILMLGVGGKMGPTLARMAIRATEEAGVDRRVIGASRFSDPELRERMESWGVQTHRCDLLRRESLAELPDAPHVLYMSGFKFGASADPSRAWAMNCYAPALCCERFRDSRVTAFSSGNVYGWTTPESGGSKVSDPPAPIGEYAWTALGRERMFQFQSNQLEIPLTLLRLNYATELRYGVLVDLALAVRDRQPIDIAMSYVNVIWLRDANEMTLRAMTLNENGQRIRNLAGQPVLRTADICRQFGELLGVEPNLVGEEAKTALLNDGRADYEALGRPATDAETMIRWTADWVKHRRPLHGKPTHFAVRDGKF